VLAAATHLSLSDSKQALLKLVLSQQYEYAFVVAKLFYPEALDQILT
jgi:hypothetical protein